MFKVWKTMALMMALILCTAVTAGAGQDLLEKIKKEGKIVIGTTLAAPPFAYRNDKGEPEGLEIDLMNKLGEYMLDILTREGFEFSRPRGAFYLLVNVAESGLESYEFAKALLREKKVAVAPGLTFGKDSDKFIRFSFCTSLDDIQEGVTRFCSFYKNRI